MSDHDEPQQPRDRQSDEPIRWVGEAGLPQPEQPADEGETLWAPQPQPRIATRVVALGTLAALVLAAGAVVYVMRSAEAGPNIDAMVPASAVVYAEANLEPSTDQRQALRRILDRFPQGETRVKSFIERTLDQGLRELGLTFERDVEPWLGARAAVAVLPGRERQPAIGVLLAVEDDAAARAALDRARAEQRDAFAYEIQDGVAIIAESAERLTSFGAGTAEPLDGNGAYAGMVGDAGDTLGHVWVDNEGVQDLVQGFSPGLVTPGLPGSTGQGLVALRAASNGIEMVGFTTSEDIGTSQMGRPALVEQAPASILGALTLFDPAKGVEQLFAQIGKRLREFQSDVDPQQQINAFLAALGLDLERDLYPWLHGEVSVVVGGISAGGLSPDLGAFDVGTVIQVTDKAAADRTMDALRRRLDDIAPVEVTRVRDGFVVRFEAGAVVVRHTGGRVVVASNDAYADQLLTTAPQKLADDAVYRRVVGDAQDEVGFQLYVRIDKIRQLVELFLPGPMREEYDRSAAPVLRPMEALGMRAWREDGRGRFRMFLSLTPQG